MKTEEYTDIVDSETSKYMIFCVGNANQVKCLIDGHHGIYVPSVFLEIYNKNTWKYLPEDMSELSSPDNENYWEVWAEVLDNAEYTDEKGITWSLQSGESGDLFIVSNRCPDCSNPLDNGGEEDQEGFSHERCDLCDALPGDRYSAHGIAKGGDITHYSICSDCVQYVANGELP